MEKKRFEQICQSVRLGDEKHIEHQVTGTEGKVVSCRGTEFEVETGDRHQNWAMQNCDETG